MVMRTGTHRAVGAALAVGMALGALAGVSSSTTVAQAAPADQPNIVIVLTDDQRRGSMGTMPVVRQQLRANGASYIGLAPTSTCCPSRAALLTGNQAHTTGVYDNFTPFGGWPTFHESGFEQSTLATALNGAGYRTALMGKYMNQFASSDAGYVPPGWDVFRTFRSGGGAGAYYDYNLVGTEPTESYGSRPLDYSTDVLANHAVDFIESTPDDKPLFLLVTPYAPHAPFTPAPRHIDSWKAKQPYRNASVNEEDMSDKPDFMQDLPKIRLKRIDRIQDRQMESLRAVDEMTGRLIEALGPRMQDTLFVFTSDNGLMWGEHRLRNKNNPYRRSTEVPLIIRWDGRISAPATKQLATNTDVSATVLDAAGVPKAFPVEGRSLLSAEPRTSVALEATKFGARPSYCGIRTKRWLFVEYNNGKGRELYDYTTDPHELENLARERKYRGKMLRLRDRAQDECSPTPPNFSW